MDSIRIETGVKEISINDDPGRIIRFNPSDVTFAEKFYDLLHDLKGKQSESVKRAEELEKVTEEDENGLPVNLVERVAFIRQTCEYMLEQIDNLFGPGSSQTVFGDTLSLEAIEQFFTGITPFIQSVRNERIRKYTNTVTDKKRKHTVMK